MSKCLNIVIVLLLINLFGLFIFGIISLFYGKTIYDDYNVWQQVNCTLIDYNINEKIQSHCHKNECSDFRNYYTELYIKYKTIENLTINIKKNLTDKSSYILSLHEVHTLFNDNPINKTINCYYLKNNPLFVNLNYPIFDHNTIYCFLYFGFFFSLTVLCFIASCINVCICLYI